MKHARLVLVTGDRKWTDWRLIYDKLVVFYGKDATVIHGNARGADFLADGIARWLGLRVIPMPADWKQHGLAAGPIRNRKMLSRQPDIVIAFHDDLAKSKGTRDCVKEATKRHIPVDIVESSELPSQMTLSLQWE